MAETIEATAEQFAKDIAAKINASRREAIELTQAFAKATGIPQVREFLMGFASMRFYEIYLPDGSLLMIRRRGPNGCWTEPYVTTRKDAALRRARNWALKHGSKP